MYSFKLIYVLIFIVNPYNISCEISDKRLCYDEKCSVPLSYAKTLLKYPSLEPELLSFNPKSDVIIYSKEPGSGNLWGAEIEGKRGYVNKNMIREYKILYKPTVLVDKDFTNPQVPSKLDINIKPDNVKQPYEVIDGTTIPNDFHHNINPSNTEVPIQFSDASDNAKQTPKENPSQQVEEQSIVSSSISDSLKDDEVDIEDEEDDDDYDDAEDDDSVIDNASIKSDNDLPSADKNISLEKQFNTEDTNLNNAPEIKLESNPKEVVPNEFVYKDIIADDKAVRNDETLQNTTMKQITDQKNGVNPSEITSNYETKHHNDSATQVDMKLNTSKVETVKIVDQASSEHVTVNTKSKSDQPEIKPESEITKIEHGELKFASNFSETIKDEPLSEKINVNSGIKQEPENLNDNGSKGDIILGDKINNTDPIEKIENEVNLQSNLPKIEYSIVPEKNVNEPNPNFANKHNETLALPDITTINSPPIQLKENTDQKNIAADLIENELAQSDNLNQSVGVNLSELEDPTTTVDSVDLKEAEVTSAPSSEYVPDFSPFGSLFGKQAVHPKDIHEDVPEDIPNHKDDSEQNSISQDHLAKDELSKVEDQLHLDGTTSHFDRESDQNSANSPEDNVAEVKGSPIAMIVTSEEETNVDIPVDTNEVSYNSGGLFSSIYSLFERNSNNPSSNLDSHHTPLSKAEETLEENIWASPDSNTGSKDDSCIHGANVDSITDVIFGFNSDFLLYLVTTAISCIIFLFVYLAIDRNRREAPLVARINKLEKDLQVTLKENELLQDKAPLSDDNRVSNKVVEELQWKLSDIQDQKCQLEQQVIHLQVEVGKKEVLEEQIESLEKELETSTEVGMELNRIISEMLDPTNGSEKLKENMDQLQRQLLEQKDTINNLSTTLSAKEIENCALEDDLQESRRKAEDLQQRLDVVYEKILKVENEKERQCGVLQKDIAMYREKYDGIIRKNEQLGSEMQMLNSQLSEATRQAELKTKEYNTLKEGICNIKSLKSEDAIKSLLESTSMSAQLEQLKFENERFIVQAGQDQLRISEYEKKYQSIQEELAVLRQKYEESDKDKTEAYMKLEVLNNYFKKRESELQEEVLKYKSIFDAKEGAVTSTSERMKLLQEEIENYKSQNETLKQEIISQEIDLKSQISVLEKKVHENWVTARQTERKLEDTRQEAAQLRNRLTLQNRGGFEDMRTQNRIQSPMDQNGDTTLSPHPSIESPASPPLLYGGRDHITKSPPLPTLPPPFLPPPIGGPFMPPPLPGMPHFMPPPPTMFPGDHRPPPLGRLSSPPPLNSRYSPCPLDFSPYDRNSPSPPYDSEYGTSPPVRGYSPFNGRDDRRDYKRPPSSRNKGRNIKGSTMSSGSENSNDSSDKMNRKQSKMV